MKTKLVNLHFELIVEVEDNASREEIMEAASCLMHDIVNDGQMSAESLTENNLCSITDQQEEPHSNVWNNAVLAKNRIARLIKQFQFFQKAQVYQSLREIEKVIGEGQEPSVNKIINAELY